MLGQFIVDEARVQHLCLNVHTPICVVGQLTMNGPPSLLPANADELKMNVNASQAASQAADEDTLNNVDTKCTPQTLSFDPGQRSQATNDERIWYRKS